MNTRPGRMVYLYRLFGYDEDWWQTRSGQAEYRQLPMGDYLFRVRADTYPLGARANTVYATIQVQLEPGDRVVFCSDGIAARLVDSFHPLRDDFMEKK